MHAVGDVMNIFQLNATHSTPFLPPRSRDSLYKLKRATKGWGRDRKREKRRGGAQKDRELTPSGSPVSRCSRSSHKSSLEADSKNKQRKCFPLASNGGGRKTGGLAI